MFSKNSLFSFILGFSFIDYMWDKFLFIDKEGHKLEKYRRNLSLQQVLEEADRSFEEEKYMDAYESLNQIKFSKDIEVVWRLARALYNLSFTPHVEHEVKKQMIQEAYEILEKIEESGTNQANYHKWMAIITNRKNGLEGLDVQIRGYLKVRDHLSFACNNSKDFTVHYMLGKLHYEMASMTWIQRKIAKYLYQEPPKSTLQEAYRHLYKAEELNPRCFLPNIYMLGCVCMKLGQYYRAKYYLNMVLNLPANNKCEQCCVSSAKNLLQKLQKYDLGLDLLYENYSFGFEN